ncbi:sulfotransferase [Sedimentitalea todarodis]|uniref:Sulfotransferase n=1 Tax=Sedimentitalea todarodis TaxID=1631240 RepID=A0ABU3VK69_9RHOB|nr:sulfotransferase [Sedimentitalea todarodis]MDU9006525.1 sulfotransferase [Sedimentitalea todarodis]
MKLSLHIGTPKSGTTTIQRFLKRNRVLLQENGVHVPRSAGESNQQRLAAMFLSDDTVDDFFRRLNLQNRAKRSAAKRRWQADLSAEIEAQPCSHVVMSSEHLQSRLHEPEAIRALSDYLQARFSDIRIILYIRDPLDTVVSLYSTAVKSGSRLAELPLSPPALWTNIVNHKATIQRWQANLTPARLDLRLFQKEDFVQGDLLADFISAAELPELDYKRPKRANESLDRLGLELLRRLNKDIPVILPDGTTNPQRGNIKTVFEAHFNGGAPFLPSAEAVAAYDTAFAASNDWVRQTFFPDRAHLFTPKTRNIAAREELAPGDLDEMAAFAAALWRRDHKQASGKKNRT